MKSYLSLSTLVYDLNRPVVDTKSYHFYLDYAKACNGRVLEPMCGSGRYLLPMLEGGIDIEGFDASQTMLDRLIDKAKLKAINISNRVWRSLANELNISMQYDLIIIPAGSFGHIIDLNTVKSTLMQFFCALSSGGKLVFEVETKYSLPPINETRHAEYDLDGNKRIKVRKYSTYNNSVFNSNDTYQLFEHNSLIKEEVEQFDVRLYNDNLTLIKMLEEAGFTDVKFIKKYDQTEKPSSNDSGLVVECQRG